MFDNQARSADGPYITRAEAARVYLRCHVTTVDRLVKAGLLKKYKFGRITLFRLSDVLALVVPWSEETAKADTARRDRLRHRARGSMRSPDVHQAGFIAFTLVLILAVPMMR
jgi:excisionase family DNA binding protein